MTSFYIGLALAIAATLNLPFAAGRALGNLIAGVALGFMAWSIVLANTDGTFARAPAGSWKPWLLNGEGVVIAVAAGLLLWAIPRQLRHAGGAVPLAGTRAAYGAITRGLHWAAATLIIAALTMGQFLSVLAPDAPPRAEFYATHIAIGGAIFLLTFARMFVRLVQPAPPNPGRVQFAHFLLYTIVTALCVTGLALIDRPVDLFGLKLPNLPAHPVAWPIHRALPMVLLVLLALHLGGAVGAIRRMAR